LIKNIGKEKTVMFSTHIMQEVEAVCDRVIIINKGKIVADGLSGELGREKNAGYTISIEFDKDISRGALSQIQGVKRVDKTGEKSWELYTDSKEDIRPSVFRFAVDQNLTVLMISRNEKNLEAVFRDVTGKS
jgi:ABC-2 type transport system ATP-binding protein